VSAGFHFCYNLWKKEGGGEGKLVTIPKEKCSENYTIF